MKISGLLEEGKTEMAGKVIWYENNGSPFGMTYITWKERQTYGNLFEKTLNLKK